MENTKDNIRKIFKEIKETPKNDFIKGVERYFRRNKQLTDKQFGCLIMFYNNTPVN